MLESEKVKADKLAFDSPSEKFMGFCSKNYGLSKYTPQNNNFVVFDKYFEKPPLAPKKEIIENDET